MGIADKYKNAAAIETAEPSEPSGPTPAETLAELRARLAGGQTGRANPPEAKLPDTLVEPKTAVAPAPIATTEISTAPTAAPATTQRSRRKASASAPTPNASGAKAATLDALFVVVELRRIADALETLVMRGG